jgi:hypothetical protein
VSSSGWVIYSFGVPLTPFMSTPSAMRIASIFFTLGLIYIFPPDGLTPAVHLFAMIMRILFGVVSSA